MRLLLFVALLAGLSGCFVEQVTDGGRPTTIVLRYTLIGESDDNGYANPGPHCSSAELRDDRIRVESDSMRAIGSARPILLVVPALEGAWATLGTGSFAQRMPADVMMDINGKDVRLATLRWIGNATHGHVEVDGDPVPIPYSWTERNRGDDWRVEANITRGPDRIETFDAGLCA